MKKITLGLIVVLSALMLFTLAGCGQEKQEQAPEDTPNEADFVTELTSTAWNFNAYKQSGTVRFQAEGTGTIEYADGQNHPFKYAVSNVTDNEKQADIAITECDLPEFNDKTMHAQITNKTLYLAWDDKSIALTPSTN